MGNVADAQRMRNQLPLTGSRQGAAGLGIGGHKPNLAWPAASAALEIQRVMPAHVVEQVGQVHDAFLREGGGEPDELAVGNHARGDFDEMLSLPDRKLVAAIAPAETA